MDDIVIFSKSLEEHRQHLRLIFQIMRKFNLRVQLGKIGILMQRGSVFRTCDEIKPNRTKNYCHQIIFGTNRTLQTLHFKFFQSFSSHDKISEKKL